MKHDTKSITEDNWAFSLYSLGKYRAFITYGAEPIIKDNAMLTDFDNNRNDIEEYYCSTLIDDDFKELESQKFYSIEEAINYINQRFNHFDFIDLEAKNEFDQSSGCGSCSNKAQ